jgi:hypothetical protein
MIRGVGPVYAKKLVRAFGEKVFDILHSHGVSTARAVRIFKDPPPRKTSWKEEQRHGWR